jgi:hypothetical protein
MLAFASPRRRRNCTDKGYGGLQQKQDGGGEMEEEREGARTTTSWTEVVPSWCGRGQRYQIGLAGGHTRDTCKDELPPGAPRMRRL